MDFIKQIIQNKQKVLIYGVLVFIIFVITGIQFFTTSTPNTPKEQEQVETAEDIKQPRPLPRKDTYTISSENAPYFTWASFDPIDYEKGEEQTVILKINNEVPAEKVTVTIVLDDTTSKIYELKLTESTDEDTTWEGSWIAVEGSKDFNYQAKLEAYGSAGEYSKVVVTFR